MRERVFLIHGWSVQSTTTYQALHQRLANYGFDLQEIYLGRYVSLEDNVEIRDIARALHRALRDAVKTDWSTPFHIITHSTGALVAKQWIVQHYTGRFAEKKPLKNIVFLAGPHFGSRLAHHGRSMLAQAAYRGDTGKNVLKALELGSEFSWQINRAWLDPASWQRKGVRPFNLIGDRVQRKLFASRIFPAGYESGSDMVVRVPAGNLNFKRFELSGRTRSLRPVGAVQNVPFAALAEYTHSGDEHGIMNSITPSATPRNHLALRLILECLRVKTAADYDRVRTLFEAETRKTRRKREAYAQLDFRVVDEDGQPVNDYVFKIGAVVKGTRRPSKTVVHTHKNKTDPNHFTAFLRLKHLEPKYAYFLEVDTRSESDLFSYEPDPFIADAPIRTIAEVVVAEQATQIELTLSRTPHRNLFVFHQGTDDRLPVTWDRAGDMSD